MSLLPDILDIQTTGDQAVLTLAVPQTLAVFDGHFPGNPILPGVVQIDWAMRLAVGHLGIADPVARDFQVKFRRIIQPGVRLALTLRHDRVKQALAFEYRIGDEVASSGRVRLEVPS
ncbi:MAG TPA: hydroxymyristoyl-ACP dehydratase [Patescibacteria group bacterium]|nr:hydroxymyristoyl-ACP dehydratase [Patescibacteria group bacterium]